jgi:hypothetical protein
MPIVKPLTKTLEVLRRSEAQWTLAAAHGGEEMVRAEPFQDIDLELARLWGGPGAEDAGR